MKKVFYSIEINGNGIPATVYIANNCTYSVYFESRFGFEVGIRGKLLVSVAEENKEQFEALMDCSEFEYKKEEFEEKYSNWCDKKTNPKEILDASFYGNQIIHEISHAEVPAIIEMDDGSQLLTEGNIKRKDNIVLYVHSDENTHHNTPHVHVKYGDDKNYCSISLTDYEILAPKNFRSAKVNESIDLLKTVIDDARLAWNNKTNGRIKFDVTPDGKPLSTTHESKSN